ncbi:MAG: Tim44 domain-containing protein [Desulfoprunum sp.]|nr:Tim44 domain-containing protein [Desulfoprunum sp.]
MSIMLRKCVPFFLVLLAFTLIEVGLTAEYADARSRGGGKSFSSAPRSAPSQSAQPGINNQRGSFSRGLAGGLLGGALGGMLFGSMFGGGGSGMGLLPILLLAGVGYFLYKKFYRSGPTNSWQGNQPRPSFGAGSGGGFATPATQPPPPPLGPADAIAEGITEIQKTDRAFDAKYFLEVASDVFFQVQAGWMRRDLQSYRHLLGDDLAAEYEEQFNEMRRLGHINKLESIAVRKVEICAAGSDGREDFVTVFFTANLLDYTVDEKTNEVVTGSMTTPVKFEEEWTWARPVGSQAWKLEGLKVVNG